MPPIRDWLAFRWFAPFAAEWADLGLGDEDMARLQVELVADPTVGDVVAGTGGVRKVRFARPGRGKSGGVRVCYAHFPEYGLILFLAVYGKGAKSNLTAADKKQVNAFLEGYRNELARE